jgi:hypothetical protein
MADIRLIGHRSLLAGLLVAGIALAAVVAPQAWAIVAPPAPPSQAPAPVDIQNEASRLESALVDEMPRLIVDGPKAAQEWVAHASVMVAASGMTIDRPRLLVVVDRNPRVQQMRLILAQPQGQWEDLGGTKVSTGRPAGYEHFLTPAGVFLHTDCTIDWRAEGTYNAHHIRGLGVEGMRVWDFGWQSAVKGWRSGTKVGEMRLLMHATDPRYLAKRLGRPASDGCIRIPEAMNIFLDRHGVLDADYEQAAKYDAHFEKVLRPDRTPTPLAAMRSSSSIPRSPTDSLKLRQSDRKFAIMFCGNPRILPSKGLPS